MKVNFDAIYQNSNNYYTNTKIDIIKVRAQLPSPKRSYQPNILDQLTEKIFPNQSLQTISQSIQTNKTTKNYFPMEKNVTSSLEQYQNKASTYSPSAKFYFETYDNSKNRKKTKNQSNIPQMQQISDSNVYVHHSLEKKVEVKESQKQLVHRLAQLPTKKSRCQKVVNQEDEKKYKNQHICLIQKFTPTINKDFKYADIKDKRYNGVLYGLTMNRSVEIIKKSEGNSEKSEEKKKQNIEKKVDIHKKLYTEHWHREFRILSKSLEEREKQKIKPKNYKNYKYLKNYVNFYQRLPNQVSKKHTKQNYYDIAYSKGYAHHQNEKQLFKPQTQQSQRTFKLKSKILPKNASYLQRLQKNNSTFSKSTWVYENKLDKNLPNIEDTQTSRQSLQNSIGMEKSIEIDKQKQQEFIQHICQLFRKDIKITEVSPAHINKLSEQQFGILFPLFTQIQDIPLSCSSVRRLSNKSGQEYTQLSESKFKQMLLQYLQNLEFDEKIEFRNFLESYNKPTFMEKSKNQNLEKLEQIQRITSKNSAQESVQQPYTQRAGSNIRQFHVRLTNLMSKSYYQKIKNFV